MKGFSKVTPEWWQSLIKHFKEQVENHNWEADGLNEELLEHVIIYTSSDSIATAISVTLVRMMAPWKKVI